MVLKMGLDKKKVLDENTYIVPSQFDSSKKYKVTHIDSYSCECQDFQRRCKGKGLYCKHIKARILFNKLKSSYETKENRGRPKSPQKKKPLNLSISEEGIDKGRKTAEHLNKSLSQFTEDMYFDLHDNFFGLNEKPEEMLKHFKKQIKDMEDIYKSKLKSEDSKG